MSELILKFEVHETGDGSSQFKIIEIITDRTPEWTMSQYLRNRRNTTMKLLSQEKNHG